jgi:hypothetical protein
MVRIVRRGKEISSVIATSGSGRASSGTSQSKLLQIADA